MNRIHRIVFNRVLGICQVASEHARQRGQAKSSRSTVAALLAVLAMAPASAWAGCEWRGGAGSWFDASNWRNDAGGGDACTSIPTDSTWVEIRQPDSDITISGQAAYDQSFHFRNGRVRIIDSGSLNSDSSYHLVGQGPGSSAELIISGAGSAWNVDGEARVGQLGTGTIHVSDAGWLNFTRGHALILGYTASNQAFSRGTLVIGADAGQAPVAPGLVNTPRIEMGRGDDGGRNATGLIVFNHTNNRGDYTFAPDISGTGGVEHYAGTTTLTGANTYTDGTLVQGGTLRATYGALGDNGAYVINGGTLDLSDYNNPSGGIDLRMSSFSGSGGTLAMGDAYVRVDQSGEAVFDGDVTGAGARLYKAGGGALTLNGLISGLANGLYVEAGTLVLNGANTYTGSTYIYDSVVEVGHDQALSAGPISVVDDLSVLRTGRNITLANEIVFSDPGEGTLTVDASHDLALTGNITDYTGPEVGGKIVKKGDGRLVVSGQSQHRGTTTVQGGTLIVDGSIEYSSQVTVQQGATLGGSGRVGKTTIEDGGRLAPGGEAIGTLAVIGGLTLSSGSMLDYQLGSPGMASDPASGRSARIDVNGDLMLDGTLNLVQSGDAADGAPDLGYYRLMTYSGGLTDHGLDIGHVPHAEASLYEIQVGSDHVDLFVPASGRAGDDTLQHWQGGDGTWNTGDARWLNQSGDIPVAWAGNHAVFKNQPGDFDGGVITIEGVQSFKGLQFVDKGYRLQGSGSLETVAGDSEIRVLADLAEIATNIGGVGGITKTEAGTLVLSGANTYRGGTTFSGGVVSVSSDANLGHEDGALTFEGGVLQVAGADFNDTERQIVWGVRGGGFDIVDEANNFYVDQNIVGPGDLVKRGDGALVLAGRNAYGNTRVEGGWLLGDAGSISGNIANAGVVAFIEDDDARFAGDITGLEGSDGTMIKDGAGSLTLEGRSLLDWSIASGTLITEASRFDGDVHLDGVTGGLTFTDAKNGVYGGVISGVGQFGLEGAGTVLLTGDSSGFSGTTVLSHGTLLVGDADGKGALGGALDILSGATLGGSGTVGAGAGSRVAVASGGTLAPGNSVGTLTVDGDLVFQVGSRFEVEADPQGGDSDRVAVTGSATLNGGSVAHIGAGGDYDLRSSYTILSAGGALSGRFDEVSSDFAFLKPELLYDYGAGTVDLELSRNDREFASAALTQNQRATANAIESIGFNAGHAAYDAIAQLPDDEALIRSSFDALSGEIHASARTALIEDSRFVRNAANDRVRAAFAAPGASTAPVQAYGSAPTPTQVSASDSGPVVWSQVFGSWGSTDSDGNAARLGRDTGGVLIGADRRMGDWRVGLLAGYSRSDFKARDRASSGKSDNYHLGLYGGTQWDALGLRAGLAYTWHDLDTKRSVSLPGLGDGAGAGYHAGTLQAFGELGYSIDAGPVRVEPYAGLAHVRLRTDGYSERGGAAALSGRSGNTDATFSTMGMRTEYRLSAGATEATLRVAAGWRHAFGDITPTARHGFSAGDTFTVAGVPIAKDSAVVEAGIDLSLAPGATLGLSYSGQLARSARDHGAKANLMIRF